MINMNNDSLNNQSIDMRQVLDLMRYDIESKLGNQLNKGILSKI